MTRAAGEQERRSALGEDRPLGATCPKHQRVVTYIDFLSPTLRQCRHSGGTDCPVLRLFIAFSA